MLFDLAWKLTRKSLSQSSYNWLSYRLFGRKIRYEKSETYTAIFNHYCENGLEFRGKTVLEVGCGLQIFTALHILRAGASRVLLAEPKVLERKRASEQFRVFQSEFSEDLSEQEAFDRILAYRSLSEIHGPSSHIDLICSYTVLEHVSDLEDFFRQSGRLLKRGGLSYHLVDVSDHTYQFFGRFPILRKLHEKRALYHLRYSNATFVRLNDPKCFMNRILLPRYIELAAIYEFEVEEVTLVPYDKPFKIHPDLLQSLPQKIEESHLGTNAFSLKLRKR